MGVTGAPMLATTTGTPLLWGGFIAFVLLMLALDLGVFHRKAHVVSLKEALTWSLVWVAFAVGFGGLVGWWFGPEKMLEYFTGYVVEKALAVDNIFVFVAVFSSFAVPALYQHRVLFWGVLGALIMRAAFIFAGAALLERFHWLLYVFGGLLLVTGVKMLMQRDQESDITQSGWFVKLRRLLPTTDGYRGDAFLVKDAGRWLVTPLFLVLVLIEVVDLIFAVDSIPAIFAITRDPFIVFTSNIFAILGLRSMYFLLADLVPRFVYLKTGLSMVLVFVGVKMMIIDIYKIPIAISLGVVIATVASSIALSMWKTRRQDLAA
jgi:tellurite resistance protein TerC